MSISLAKQKQSVACECLNHGHWSSLRAKGHYFQLENYDFNLDLKRPLGVF